MLKELIIYKNNLELNNDLVKKVIICNNEEKEDIIIWNELNRINEDIIGWIKIDNTNINYPILLDNDNLYYLNHSFNNDYDKNGSIFTLDSSPFTNKITNIYGHNMKSGLMFSDLKNYLDKDFFTNHQEFVIYTKNQNYIARVFSAYSTGIKEEESNIKDLSFDEEINYYKKMSAIKVDENDDIKNIVKLSTCSYINNHVKPTNQRYYIIAKIEKEK